MARLEVLLVLVVVVGCGSTHDAIDVDAAAVVVVDATPGGEGGLDAAAADVLDPSVLHEVAIDIAAADLPSFDVDQTVRVPCDVRWDGTLISRSGCRKKGSSGS